MDSRSARLVYLEVVMNYRSGNFSASSYGLSDPVTSGKFPNTPPGVLFKILTPSKDVHIATEGLFECRSRR